ncbi:hypothetical protein SAMN05444007_104371 [Cribrihabitans marinus]|uniref:Uncharacterized protein n=1 Tax=Cribrihabitans marinus TaxID=1227549 RepID=A0A1H6YTM2_9RHOB|nr:hypothetical protein [Cribrihabitans marinus]GGH29229.1 hypothetical protein GCM10010973_18630 [Cribrihabitans marinus]SEJ40612.1 hypothetical protein SAMN05444007_104371 [Cribrihabitans marinus]
MAKIKLKLAPEKTISAQDVKKIADKVNNKTKTFMLRANEVDNGKVKAAFDVKKELLAWALRDFGLSGATAKLLVSDAQLDGQVSDLGDYDLVFSVSAKVEDEVKTFKVKGTLTLDAKEAEAAPEPCRVTYENAKVKSACTSDNKIKTKIESIALAGTDETGHGKVPYLNNAFHAHVTNTESVAWFWRQGGMHVVATGKKNNQNKQQKRGGKGASLKTMEYDWYEG